MTLRRARGKGLTVRQIRPESRASSSRRRNRSLIHRARATSLLDLLRYLVLRHPAPRALWKSAAGLHEWLPHLGLSHLYEIRPICPQ